MTEDEFAGLVGDRLLHVTAAANLPSIRRRGLLRPVALARLAGVDPEGLRLRREAVVLALPDGTATLNHQIPLRAGLRQDFLDGVTIEDWAGQLDGRVFLWPARRGARFAASVAARGDTATLALDARGLFRAMREAIDLAPINTGSALRRPARRGPGTYVPVTGSVEAFRAARGRRDDVAEVSVRADIAPDLLARIVTGWPSA